MSGGIQSEDARARMRQGAAWRLERDREPAFWARVDKSGDCWIWQGAVESNGYGVVKINYRLTGAHRVAWTMTHGPIPARMSVLHRCDNPPCVNPAHLWLGTAADNLRDMVAKGRQRHAKGEAHATAKLTTRDVVEILMLAEHGWRPRDLAARYAVTTRQVSRIVARKQWRHIPWPQP